MMNNIYTDELSSELSGNEHLIWTGKPKQGIVFRGSDIFIIPFSLIWSGFVVFWMTAMLVAAPFPLGLFGIPFIAVGFYILVGRFFIDARKRSRTVYGVTNERILIRTGIFNLSTQSFYIKNLPDITVKEKMDGTGTISIGGATNGIYFTAFVSGMPWPGLKSPSQLELIDNVRSVYNTIIELQTKK
jgi:hypothetical protein